MPCFVDRFVDEHDRSVRRSPVRATRMESAGSNGRRDATRLLGEGGRTPRVALPVLGRRPHAAAQRGHTVLKLPPPFEHTPRLTRHEISRYDDRGPVWAWDCRTAAPRDGGEKGERGGGGGCSIRHSAPRSIREGGERGGGEKGGGEGGGGGGEGGDLTEPRGREPDSGPAEQLRRLIWLPSSCTSRLGARGATYLPGQVPGSQVAADPHEPAGMPPPVRLERGVDVELDNDPGLHSGVGERLARMVTEPARRDRDRRGVRPPRRLQHPRQLRTRLGAQPGRAPRHPQPPTVIGASDD